MAWQCWQLQHCHWLLLGALSASGAMATEERAIAMQADPRELGYHAYVTETIVSGIPTQTSAAGDMMAQH